jgi:ABC-type Fe3+/spermidine/putrescine transport system ATPase subunit
MASLSLQGIAKSFGSTRILHDVSLDIHSGEFFSLLGPSGCGKSTLLRIIAGLETPDRGSVCVAGSAIDHIAPQKRGIGMVFQQYALWPHMTIGQNVRFGLESSGLTNAERDSRAIRALERVQMASFQERYPHEISGGQQQRVALARALAIQPSIILLDEPLSNLDARLRAEIREELVDLHHSLGTTMVYVTHDQEDALALSSRIALIHEGTIQQVGTPREIYQHPTSPFVAKFIGDANLIPCSVVSTNSDGLVVQLQMIEGRPFRAAFQAGGAIREGDSGFLCIRPSCLSLTRNAVVGECPSLQTSVRRITYRGVDYAVELEGISPHRILAAVRESQLPQGLKDGERVFISWEAGLAVFVPAQRNH